MLLLWAQPRCGLGVGRLMGTVSGMREEFPGSPGWATLKAMGTERAAARRIAMEPQTRLDADELVEMAAAARRAVARAARPEEAAAWGRLASRAQALAAKARGLAA